MIKCNKSVYLANKSIDMIDAVNKGYADGYNKAIDVFADKLNEKCDGMIKEKWNSNVSPISWAEAYADFKDDIDEIAEQLKAGVENEKERNAFDNAKQIVQEVAEEYKGDMKHNLAEMYAKNMVDYGVDVTKEWQTATQQSCALEKAFIRGIQYERDRFIELRKEYNNGWIHCSGCKDCKNKECEHYGKV